jgi:hypothetical protein
LEESGSSLFSLFSPFWKNLEALFSLFSLFWKNLEAHCFHCFPVFTVFGRIWRLTVFTVLLGSQYYSQKIVKTVSLKIFPKYSENSENSLRSRSFCHISCYRPWYFRLGAWPDGGGHVRVWMGGVNHCSLHCRLAKIRGLMYERKYGAVIGRETRFSVCVAPSNNFQAMDFCSQSQRRISPRIESIHGISPNDSVIYSG